MHAVCCCGVCFAFIGIHTLACHRTGPRFLAFYVARVPFLICVPVFCHTRRHLKCVGTFYEVIAQVTTDDREGVWADWRWAKHLFLDLRSRYRRSDWILYAF